MACACVNGMFSPKSGITLGKLAGIELRMHWSLLVIFSLILMSLATSVFPAWHPDWSPGLVWLVAAAATVLFFGSIVAHEMGHALVARHYGMPVSSITLFLFGGIASLDEDPDTPKKEALMAGVGPVISIVLGILFVLVASLAISLPVEAAEQPEFAARQMGPVATLLAWLGPVNIIIGLFNLLPAFPLDGGRVLRAALWQITNDLVLATRWATRAGQLLGLSLMLGGVAMALGLTIPIFGSGFASGVWLAFIGWFLYGAAVASHARVLAQQTLHGIRVGAVMRSKLPEFVRGDESVENWVKHHVLTSGAERYPVQDDQGRVVGLVRASDARLISREEWPTTPVTRVMQPLQATTPLSVDEDAFDALKKLGRANPPATDLPVLQEGELVGLFGPRDIERYLELQGALPSKQDTAQPLSR